MSVRIDLSGMGCDGGLVTVERPSGRDRSMLHCGLPRENRNGAVASAVLVHLAWTGPLRLALAGATRTGTAGVGYLLAIRNKIMPHPPRRFDTSQDRS